MEVRLYDLAADAVANAVDQGYIYVECVGCGSGGYWAKPKQIIECPLCSKPIVAPEDGQSLVAQVREWREMFLGYCDSHIGAIGYQVCERLIEELTENFERGAYLECVHRVVGEARKKLARSRTAGCPSPARFILEAENDLVRILEDSNAPWTDKADSDRQ